MDGKIKLTSGNKYSCYTPSVSDRVAEFSFNGNSNVNAVGGEGVVKVFFFGYLCCAVRSPIVKIVDNESFFTDLRFF